ncbi:MAG TPA: hypothetical protein VLA17_08800 [Candidatus Limnocylindria bacterium]|nr:hypothetical protein [Candidatus Limnocylindria bacterium]
MRYELVSAIVTALCLMIHGVAAADYKYPYHDPYLATATVAILSDEGATARRESTILRVPGLPGRNHLPPLEGRGHVSLSLYRQRGAAPLLFILAGLGSNPYFGVAPYLASLFHKEGFHVVILPSPMSWNFALSASRSGAPGYAPQDAHDLYEVMQKALATLRNRFNIKPASINLLAVSLGALQSAYLSVLDADEKKIGIAKYLLINPPVDLAYGVRKIDEWHNLASHFGLDKARQTVSKALAIVESFDGERRNDPGVVARLVKKFKGFTTAEIQFLIGQHLQSQLPELIYTTQVIRDQKVLNAPKDQMRARLEEAKSFTFTDYNQKIALPLWQKQTGDPQANLASFFRRGSLAHIVDRLRGNPKVHILHNADDFLAERKSIEALKQALGEQVTLYPYGGHLGNLWFPDNKKHFLRFFRPRE